MSPTMSSRIAAGVTTAYLRDLTRRAPPTVDAAGRHDARRIERAVVCLVESDRRPGLAVRGDRRVVAGAGGRVRRRPDDGVLSG